MLREFVQNTVYYPVMENISEQGTTPLHLSVVYYLCHHKTKKKMIDTS